MKIIVLDSGLGGKDFINKMKNIDNMPIEFIFVKLFKNMITTYDKNYVRYHLIQILYNYTITDIDKIVIACHSASSCILDILIDLNFEISNIKIYEQILPMCTYIQQKK